MLDNCTIQPDDVCLILFAFSWVFMTQLTNLLMCNIFTTLLKKLALTFVLVFVSIVID